MKATHHRALRALIGFSVASLVGCASYRPPVAIPEAKIPAAKVAAARDQMESIKGLNKDVETVAAASADTCSHRGLRMPFFAANNPQVKDEEVRAAFYIAGLREQPLFISTGPSTQALDGKYITKMGSEVILPGDAAKANWTARANALSKHDDKAVSVEFSDKTSGTVKPFMGCEGIVFVDFEGNEPANLGLEVEVLPIEWFKSATLLDERFFLAGRSLYFASDVGVEKLARGFMSVRR